MSPVVTHADTLSALNASLPDVRKQIKDILSFYCNKEDMPARISTRVSDYFNYCMDYNIAGGKLARARTVSETLTFCKGVELGSDSKEVQAALLLGWAVEILQAFFLIEDDVMDRGETRRGRKCWYRMPDVGIANAINDGLLLEQVLYELIEMNPNTKHIAIQAHRILRDASMRTVIGQHLDTHPPDSVIDFTRDQWLSVVRFKTAFYTFVLPCELGILVSGRTFPQTDLTRLREVCLLVGELFQAQDDMLDCFGDPAVIGKVGRDIEEGKCTWLWYTAVDALAENEALRTELIDLYSSENRADDPVIVARVKEIYKHIEIQKRFDEYLSSMAVDINSKISSIISPELRDLCVWLVASTKGRNK